MLDIEKGKPVHCSETVTGFGLTGTLLIAEDELRVDLYSYAEPFHIKTDAPIHLIAATGQTISLHACIDGGSGTTRNYECTTYHQALIANLAVVGHDAWVAGNRLRRASFCVEHAMDLLRHRAKFDAIGQTRYPSEEHLLIFEDRAERMTLRAYYSGSWGMDFDAPKRLWPVFEIEFDEPQEILEYIQHVSYYVEFLSFCLGVKLRPHDIRIDRLSHAETVVAVEAKTYQPPHQIHYVWPETDIDSSNLWVGASPVRAWDDEELAALRACLVAWVDRSNSWKKPYMMMMSSFGLKNVMSAERLINACRWCEELPNAQSRNAISQSDIETIAAVAASEAEGLGHDAAIRERIASAIKRIKEESAAERLARLVALVEDKFGEGVLSENAVIHLRQAIRFRGKTAHGHFTPESDEEYRAFCKSVRAMEALCYLLTAIDLPILREGFGRVWANPLVRDYRLSYE